jgi:hypothetical protein
MTPQEQEYQKCICGDCDCKIPFGLCHCGCGMQTVIAQRTEFQWRAVKGFPRLFVISHRARPVRVSPPGARELELTGAKYRLLPLNKDLYVIVDATDYVWLMQWSWYAKPMRDKSVFYAARTGINTQGKSCTIFMHREILGLPFKSDGVFGDHINRLTTDNRRVNLRPVSNSQNCRNQRMKGNNTSGFKGVSFRKDRGDWVAYITVEGQRTHLGFFCYARGSGDRLLRSGN